MSHRSIFNYSIYRRILSITLAYIILHQPSIMKAASTSDSVDVSSNRDVEVSKNSILRDNKVFNTRINKEEKQSTYYKKTIHRLKKDKKEDSSNSYFSYSHSYKSTSSYGFIGKSEEKAWDNPEDNIFEINIPEKIDSKSEVWLSYDIQGLSSGFSASKRINFSPSIGGGMIKRTTGWHREKERINPEDIYLGVNKILFTNDPEKNYNYQVKNVELIVNPTKSIDLIQLKQSNLEYQGKQHLQGFINIPDSEINYVKINSEPVSYISGFSKYIDASSAIEIEAVLKDGNIIKKDIPFSKKKIDRADFELSESSINKVEKIVEKNSQATINLSKAELKVSNKDKDLKKISLWGLRSVDIASLDMGMENLTAGGYSAYHINLNGISNVEIKIPYERSKIPMGYSETDIVGFYFNENTKHWVAVQPDLIDRVNKVIHIKHLVSSLNIGDQDMISGIIKTPESPESKGFSPTDFKDMKAADPHSKVGVLSAPSSSSSGAANMSYSFEIPPARNGMQPSLGISYNSDSGNGWLGRGWNLSLSKISIDSRWGVPRYKEGTESETYLLDGQMLATMQGTGATVAHRDLGIPRVADRQFYSRKEGSFSRIIRKGSTVGNYTWEITDKSGTKYTYGGNGGILKGNAKTPDGDKEVIAEWYLSKVEEIHGDQIEYFYDQQDEVAMGGLISKAVYLKKIESRTEGIQGNPHTLVEFTTETLKDKKTNNGRLGFLISENKLLDKVSIKFEGKPLRSYEFKYIKGAFSEHLLNQFIHNGADGKEFNHHEFEYYDDIAYSSSSSNYQLFEKEEKWNTSEDFEDQLSPSIGEFNGKLTSIGNALSAKSSGSLYVGIGVSQEEDMITKSGTAGISLDYGIENTTKLVGLLDINGDGLPDKVIKQGGNIYYRPNRSNWETPNIIFGEKLPVVNINDISKTIGNNFSFGGKITVGAFGMTAVGGVDTSFSTSKEYKYLMDVNGDGLIDLVDNGKVLFNHIDNQAGNLIPTFTDTSADTPSPINSDGSTINTSDTAVDPNEQADLIKNSPLTDMVRVWEAPFVGTVNIKGDVRLLHPDDVYGKGKYDEETYKKADGVKVSIEIGESNKWEQIIKKGDTKTYQSLVSNITVTKGQKIYFRLQSGIDPNTSNGAFDQVDWDPTVEYTGKTNLANSDGDNYFVFPSSTSYVVDSNLFTRVAEGTTQIKLKSKFIKPITSDNITLKIIQFNDAISTSIDKYKEKIVYEKSFRWDETSDGILEQQLPIIDPSYGNNYRFLIESNTNVAWNKIIWDASLAYTPKNSPKEISFPAFISHTIYIPHTSVKKFYESAPYTVQNIETNKLQITPYIQFKDLNKVCSGKIVYSVKSASSVAFKAKATFQYKNGALVNSGEEARITVTNVNKNDKFWIEIYSDNPDLITNIKEYDQNITYNTQVVELKTTGAPLISKLKYPYFQRTKDYRFGPMYRGWGQFTYNSSANGRYGKAIVEKDLDYLPPSVTIPLNPSNLPEVSALTQIFMPLSAMSSPNGITKSYWQGADDLTYIKANIMSSSRLGLDDVILSNPLSESSFGSSSPTSGGLLGIGGSGTFIPTKLVKNISTSVMVGAGGLTASTSKGKSNILIATMDMNGDNYPDIVTKNMIQYTNSKGAFDGVTFRSSIVQEGVSSSYSIGYGGNPVHAISTIASEINRSINGGTTGNMEASSSKGLLEVINESLSITGSKSVDNDRVVKTYGDINGDGLADKIFEDNTVAFNLGYGFSNAVNAGITIKKESSGSSTSLGLGFDFGASSIEMGVGMNLRKESEISVPLLDINSDGLPDQVRKDGNVLKVRLNKGDSFEEEKTINGEKEAEIEYTNSIGASVNVAYTLNIPLQEKPLIKLSINPEVNISASVSRIHTDIQDMDGDGFADFISSQAEADLYVNRSKIKRTNKLKSVRIPIGGIYVLDYIHTPASYDYPNGKWALGSVSTDDKINDDGANIKMVFKYKSGRYERHEREFLGFGEIISCRLDADNNYDLYSQVVTKRDISDYYKAGQTLENRKEDNQGNSLSKSTQKYYNYEVTATADTYSFSVPSKYSDRSVRFSPNKYTKNEVYESGQNLILNENFSDYYLNGYYGELKNYKYSDKGNLGEEGNGDFNYKTQIEYISYPGKHILSLPIVTKVLGNNSKIYRENQATYEPQYAHMIESKTRLTSGKSASPEWAITNIDYNPTGTIKLKTLPANYLGQRMFYKYFYERKYNTYPERIEDAYGYHSEMEDFNYAYGVPLTTRDINGFETKQTLDQFGRVITMFSPNELADGARYTIKFDYHPEVFPAYSVTNHYDIQHRDDDLQTIRFVDGLGKDIQLKKEGIITEVDENGTNPKDKKVWLVSGRLKYDGLGRLKESYYSTTDLVDNAVKFSATFDKESPSKNVYDVNDRVSQVITPDGRITESSYRIDMPSRSIVSEIIDAKKSKVAAFSNGSGLRVKTESYSGPEGTITTKFEYNSVNENTKVIDNQGNEVEYQYDIAGRIIKSIHPDAHTESTLYDATGNILERQTENLKNNEDKKITYEYDYTRNTRIHYPEHPENDVKMYYGNQNAKYNRRGRLGFQEDASGGQEFFYGRMGELIKVQRTFIVPNNAVATYVTQWGYDSFYRLQNIIYPDQEKVSYKYNTAGMLDNITGHKEYDYNYVTKIGYDKFESRLYMKNCNSDETLYSYNPTSRSLSNLKVWTTQDSWDGTSTKKRQIIIDNDYELDEVNNLLRSNNKAESTQSPTGGIIGEYIGGQMTQNYTYDGLHRLTGSKGIFTGKNQKTADYSLDLKYDNIYNIIQKTQKAHQNGVTFNGDLRTGYELNYQYSQAPHQISKINDVNYRTEGNGQKIPIDNNHYYEYDGNGNIIHIKTDELKDDGHREENIKEKKYIWDEENRLEASSENGYVTNFWYDASGTRTIKISGDNEEVFVNSIFSGGRTQTHTFTLYVNPYLVFKNDGEYTKHIYMGSQRIVSKMGDKDTYGADPRRIEKAGFTAEDYQGNPIMTESAYKDKYILTQKVMRNRYDSLKVEYHGFDNNDYAGGSGFCCDNTSKSFKDVLKGQKNNELEKKLSAKQKNLLKSNPNMELLQFYYHPDHIGSATYVTNHDGEVVQHLEYTPYGELFLQEINKTWNSPYLFTGKEYDEETGLYYFGARYYDPKTSVWLSVDPEHSKYPGWSPYNYGGLNPMKFVDPDGKRLVINNWQGLSNEDRDYIRGTLNEIGDTGGDGSHYGTVSIDTNGGVDVNSHFRPSKLGWLYFPPFALAAAISGEFSTPSRGLTLLTQIVNSPRTVAINYDSNGSRIRTTSNSSRSRLIISRDGSSARANTGSNATIYFSNATPSTYEYHRGGLGNHSVQRNTSSRRDIILQHELLHAFHAINGVRLPDDFRGLTNQYSNLIALDTDRSYLGRADESSTTRPEELFTVGLGDISSHRFYNTINNALGGYGYLTENDYRYQAGLNQRAFYSPSLNYNAITGSGVNRPYISGGASDF